LLKRDAWEQCDGLADRNAVFEVLEESGNGHARATKDPRSANALRVSLYHRTT
jgi:hypothetical protein